jgi:hypothetical protein
MSPITVTLLNWKRPKNMERLLDSLHKQTLKPVIFLWNNGDPLRSVAVDWLVQSSENLKCWPRWLLGSLATTPYICSLDDDLALKDDRVLSELVKVLEDDDKPDRVFGLAGLVLPPGIHYTQGKRPTEGPLAPADIIKGRMMAFRTAALKKLTLQPRGTEDDIAVCGLLANRRRLHHRQITWLRDRIEELPDQHAYCSQPGHYERRNQAIRQFLYGEP